MKPATLFKILVGTLVIMLVSTMALEVGNMQLTAPMITQYVNTSINQACQLFGQETYKRADAQDINEANLVGLDGATVSGDFYGSANPTQIYNSLYGSGSDFVDWAKDHAYTWSTLDNLLAGLNIPAGIGDKKVGDVYVETKMTPLNLGITYLDQGTIQKIARWNLTNLLCDGIENGGRLDRLRRDANGVYVQYKGFKVYTGELRVEGIDYEVVSLMQQYGKDYLMKYGHLDADKLLANMGGALDERGNICFATVRYSLPIKYDGITNLKRITEFFWNKQVDGLTDGSGNTLYGYSGNQSMENTMAGATFNSPVTDMTGGGFGYDGTIAVPGKIVYFVTR